MNATVEKLRFYERDGGLDSIKLEDRVYSGFFKANTARYIMWELDLNHSSRYSDTKLAIHTQWFDEDGKRFWRNEDVHTIPASWPGSRLSDGYGRKTPGLWDPGSYEVDLYVEGDLIARGGFEVYD
jgi:hypothetical protein